MPPHPALRADLSPSGRYRVPGGRGVGVALIVPTHHLSLEQGNCKRGATGAAAIAFSP